MSDVDALAELAEQGITIERAPFESWSRARASTASRYELALVWACLQHDARAIELLERDYLPQAQRALARLNLDAATRDDVLGWLRAELFAREEGPLLEKWSGRGNLGGWLRAIAAHEGLKRLEHARKHDDVDELDVPMPDGDALNLKGAHRAEFTRALEASFRALPLAQRNLLRQYFLDGLTVDDLAKLLGVHRATAARRVNAARDALVDGVKGQLMRELAMGAQSVDEVITLSNLDKSLAQLLRHSE